MVLSLSNALEQTHIHTTPALSLEPQEHTTANGSTPSGNLPPQKSEADDAADKHRLSVSGQGMRANIYGRMQRKRSNTIDNSGDPEAAATQPGTMKDSRLKIAGLHAVDPSLYTREPAVTLHKGTDPDAPVYKVVILTHRPKSADNKMLFLKKVIGKSAANTQFKNPVSVETIRITGKTTPADVISLTAGFDAGLVESNLAHAGEAHFPHKASHFAHSDLKLAFFDGTTEKGKTELLDQSVEEFAKDYKEANSLGRFTHGGKGGVQSLFTDDFWKNVQTEEAEAAAAAEAELASSEIVMSPMEATPSVETPASFRRRSAGPDFFGLSSASMYEKNGDYFNKG